MQRVSNERLKNVRAYCDSSERQGYPMPISEFANTLDDLLDARAEIERLREIILRLLATMREQLTKETT